MSLLCKEKVTDSLGMVGTDSAPSQGMRWAATLSRLAQDASQQIRKDTPHEPLAHTQMWPIKRDLVRLFGVFQRAVFISGVAIDALMIVVPNFLQA